MHHSKLTNIVIDCPAATFTEAVAFWSRALGMKTTGAGTGRYVTLNGCLDQVEVILQRVEGEAEVHLDFETDDLQAETARLEALGAKPKYPIKNWLVMKAPSQHSFCIVKRDPANPLPTPNQWP